MASVNSVIIIGNLGKEPEVRYTPNGDKVATINVATTDTWKDKQTGEKKSQTEWHRITFFRQLADIAEKYLNKGSQVYVEGKLQTSKYTGKDGVERYQTVIVASQMQMLGSRPDGQQQGQQSRPAQRNSYADAKNGTARNDTYQAQDNHVPDDDIPF